jgi:hypothetical protein
VRARATPSRTRKRSRLLKKLPRPSGRDREDAADRYGGRDLVPDAMRADAVETDGCPISCVGAAHVFDDRRT